MTTPHNKKVVLLDSSGLLRNNNISLLEKNFTRNAYNKNPITFINQLNSLLKKNSIIEKKYQNLLLNLLSNNRINNIITMDCTFSCKYTDQILNIFGVYDKSSENISNLCLFKESISVDTYLHCYNILTDAYTIILDDYFCCLQLGKFLLNRIPYPHTFNLSSYSSNKYLSTFDAYNALLNFFNYQEN